jgi:FMN phosphatase YigB (HAD superfamily)
VERVIFWDFDGTLAERPGLWGACLAEVLDEEQPDHGIELDQLRAHLRDGFPWHDPETAHPELNDPEAWWERVETLLARAYAGCGLEAARAAELAGLVRNRYCDPARGWSVFDDVQPVLERLKARGWTHVILSNHIPELAQLVNGLGLSGLLDRVLTSAATGYEKPNPRAFENALHECGDPQERWMIGDNPEADVAGAEAAGIRAILVRRTDAEVERVAADLYAVKRIIDDGAA